MRGDDQVIPALRAARRVRGGELRPRLARIVGPPHTEQLAIVRRTRVLECILYRRVQHGGRARRDGQNDAPDVGGRESPGEPRPRLTTVVSPVDARRRVAARAADRRVERARLRRVYHQVRRDAVQHARPGHARIGGTVHTETAGHVDRRTGRRAGRRPVHDHLRDARAAAVRVEDARAELSPARAPIGRAQQAAAVVAVAREMQLARARVDDVGIDRVQRDRSHRERAFAVRQRRPALAAVDGAPDTALRTADVDHAGRSRMHRDRRDPAGRAVRDRRRAERRPRILDRRRRRVDARAGCARRVLRRPARAVLAERALQRADPAARRPQQRHESEDPDPRPVPHEHPEVVPDELLQAGDRLADPLRPIADLCVVEHEPEHRQAEQQQREQ